MKEIKQENFILDYFDKDWADVLQIDQQNVKGNVQFIFLCDPKKSSVSVCLMKILKSTVTKK